MRGLEEGPEVLYREMVLPHLKGTYEDLLSVANRADLLIAGELVYAAPMVAEKMGLRWVSAILSPFSFFSAFDPSVMPNAPGLIHLRKAGPSVYRAALKLGRLATRYWSNPVRDLRREQGLRPECDPVFRDKFSPYLVLALFSHWLAEPQRDWPLQTRQPGFVYFDDRSVDAEVSSRLSGFLATGDAPIVFTQGSTAVHNPGDFYSVSVAAAKRLGRRAVLLGAKAGSWGRLPGSSGVILCALLEDIFLCCRDCASGWFGNYGRSDASGAAYADRAFWLGSA